MTADRKKEFILAKRSKEMAIGATRALNNSFIMSRPTSSTVESDVDELLEFRRRCSSATYEEQDPLTPIQRRH
jgi:hypothetical protein